MRIKVRKVPPLQQWIIGEINPRHNILGAEGDLFGFGKEVFHRPVKFHRTDDLHRAIFFGDQFCGIQHVERKAIGKRLIEQLYAEIPFRVIAPVDGIPQITAVAVGIGPVTFHRLVPDHRLQAHARLPVEFDKGGCAINRHEPESVNAKPLHRCEGSRDRTVRHGPHDRVHCLGR